MKQYAQATERNREPILAVLQRILPREGKVLEIASGTGQHAVFFSNHMPGLEWQPSDPNPDARESILAWKTTEGGGNLLNPIALDVTEADWGMEQVNAVVCINMVHISPWAASEGLFRGAAALLSCGEPLFLYGPYKLDGEHTSASNEAFDASLRSRNATWGVRDLGDIRALAEQHGFDFSEKVPMPANNFSVIFIRR